MDVGNFEFRSRSLLISKKLSFLDDFEWILGCPQLAMQSVDSRKYMEEITEFERSEEGHRILADLSLTMIEYCYIFWVWHLSRIEFDDWLYWDGSSHCIDNGYSAIVEMRLSSKVK